MHFNAWMRFFLTDIFFAVWFSAAMWHNCMCMHFMKSISWPLCFLFRTVYVLFGSLQMFQHRTGNNTALETIQSFEEKVLQSFHKRKGPKSQTTASVFSLVWHGLICLILPLLHLPVCHFQPKMSSIMRGLDSLQFTCCPHPSSDDLRTFPFHGQYCIYVMRFL